MSQRLRIPTRSSEIDASWLSQLLTRSQGMELNIRDIEVTPLGADYGLMSSLCRVLIHYRSHSAVGPSTLVAKLPALDSFALQIASTYRLYEREVGSYASRAAKGAIRVPQCYVAQISQSDRFLLLLEDLGHLQTQDQLVGSNLPTTRSVIREAARFHAAWWNSDKLARMHHLPGLDDQVFHSLNDAYRHRWPLFRDRFAERASARSLRTARVFGQQMSELYSEWVVETPFTYLHGDLRLDNILASKNQNVTILDWQLAMRWSGAFDIAHFLAGSLSRSQRRQHEFKLLEEYHNCLVSYGVSSYSYSDCIRDYRRAMLALLPLNIIFGSLETGDDRSLALRRTVADRCLTAIDDLEAQDFLS